MSTFAMPICEGETVQAVINVSFFTTAFSKDEAIEKVLAPLRATRDKIEHAIAAARGGLSRHDAAMVVEPAF
jgi:hypothetical protein